MKTIVLVGGNEFRPDCIAMDEHLLRLLPAATPRVLVVPTAAAQQRPELAAQNGIQYFTALGAQATALLAITREDWARLELQLDVAEADMIYLTGGDPWYLLQTIRETPLFKAILDRCDAGAILAGSSAGAMVLGGYMRRRDGEWTPGLSVVPSVVVLPHYRVGARTPAPGQPPDLPQGVVLVGVGEATGLVAHDRGSWEVIGTGSVCTIGSGEVREYHAGESFVLSQKP